MEHNLPDQEAAFRAIIAHLTLLKSCAFDLTRDTHLAKDVLSDATLEMVRSWSQFDSKREFAPWACRIVRRVAMDHLERRGREPTFLDEETLDEAAAYLQQIGDEAALEDRKEALHHCLLKMPNDQRTLIEQRYFHQRSYREIAQLNRKTERALYILFTRMRQMLQICILEQELQP